MDGKGIYQIIIGKAEEIFLRLAEYRFSFRAERQECILGFHSSLTINARDIYGSLYEIAKGENDNDSLRVLNGKSKLIEALKKFKSVH